MILRRFLWVFIFVIFFVLSGYANKRKQHIVILNSAAFNEHWSSSFLESIGDLSREENFIISTFELMVPLLENEEQAQELQQRVLQRFPEKPDVVVLIGDPGWIICSPLFDREWKGVPVVLCYSREQIPASVSVLLNKEPLTAENSIPLKEFNKNYNVTVLWQPSYVYETVKMMKQIIPGMNKVAFISDHRYISNMVREEVKRVLKADFPEIQFLNLCNKEMTTVQLLDSLVNCDRNVGIIYYSWFMAHSEESRSYLENNVWKAILGFTHTPVFVLSDMGIGKSNFVGGYYISIVDFTKKFIHILEKILSGTPANAIPYQCGGDPRRYLNYVALRWYQIDPGLYPADAVYIKAPPTFYQQYKYFIYAILSVLILTVVLRYYFGRIGKRHEQLNKRIIFSIQDPVVLINRKGIIEKLLNYPSYPHTLMPVTAIEGWDIRNLILRPEEYELHMNLLEKVLSTKNSEHLTITTKNLEKPEIYLFIRLVYFDSERVIAFVQNVTEIELERKKSERYRFFLESTLNNLPIPTSVKDMNNHLKYLIWNKSSQQLYGVTEKEIMEGKNDTLGENLTTLFRETDEIAIQQGQFNGICKTVFANGEKHTLLMSKVVLSYKDGQKWLVCSAMDITELERSREQQQILNKKYELVLRATHLIPWVWNLPEKRVVCRLKYIQDKEEEPVGEKVMDEEEFYAMILPEDREKVRKAIKRLIDGEVEAFKEEYRAQYGDSVQWFEAYAIVSKRDEEGKPTILVGAFQGIQARKEMEQELRSSKEQAEESNRLKSAFLANMSHEIRTPLNAIVGFSGILAELNDTPECQEYVKIIQNNNQLLLQLINDILDLSKIEADTLDFTETAMDVNTNLSEIIESARLRLKTDTVELLFEEFIPNCVIYADDKRIAQVLINFLNNAMKFTQKGSIKMGYRLLTETSQLYFYVRDTGCGIEADKQKLIFGRFTKLNSFVQGTGLGLSICETIVHKMNGEIGVISVPNEGSEFWFTIPYHPIS